ncbi:MGMT family protein [Candidatus Woesearchaeota archaeon]|nr:MGMT family protein [Candidatus Woesearchaeota archaeon]
MKTFQQKVLDLCKKIPKGRVSTYKIIGKKLGGRGQIYRAVGGALHDNKLPVKIPCHRVVCSDGSIGGYSRGVRKKVELLKKEGIIVKNGKIKDFQKNLFSL